jgi:hypothetical protein
LQHGHAEFSSEHLLTQPELVERFHVIWAMHVLTIYGSPVAFSGAQSWADRPNLPPSDFFLLGSRRQQIKGVHYPDQESLKTTIYRIFTEIDRELSMSMSLDLIGWLKWVIKNNWEERNSERRLKEKLKEKRLCLSEKRPL